MPDAPPFEIGYYIPVWLLLDETEAKAFYVGYLGFEIDWEHRYEDSPSSPLYMQVSLGQAVIHLNGHVTRETPVAEERIPVKGIDAYGIF